MAIIGSTQFLERIQFFNGERLFASDLQALEAFNREMRWLHNQSLHQAGVGSGFQVTGNVGDRQVTVFPGYALDSCGREIILTESQVLAIPPVADNGSGGSVFYDLTVSYPPDAQLIASETRDGVCVPQGVVRLREEPVFCWVRLGDDPTNRQSTNATQASQIKTGLMIVLAQIEVFNCQLKQPVNTTQRRNARPSKQLHVACGQTQPGGWSNSIPWGGASPTSTTGITFDGHYYWLAVKTASGSFRSTPNYAARLVGSRNFITADIKTPYMLDALINIPQTNPDPTNITGFIAPSSTGFTVQIFTFYASWTSAIPNQSDIDSWVQTWAMSWLGVES